MGVFKKHYIIYNQNLLFMNKKVYNFYILCFYKTINEIKLLDFYEDTEDYLYLMASFP